MRRHLFLTLIVLASTGLVASTVQAQEDASESAPEGSGETGDTDSSDDGPAAQPDGPMEVWVASLPITGRRIVIATPQETGTEAAETRLTALLDDAGATLVIDDTPMGLTPTMADPTILDSASNLPVDVVIVVRIMGSPSSLIASAYTPAGDSLGAFSMPADELVSQPPAGSVERTDPAPQPMQIGDDPRLDATADRSATQVEETAGRDAEAQDETGAATAENLARYESEKIVLVAFDGSTLVLSRGDAGERFEGVEALELLGLSDRIEEFESTWAWKRGLYWTAAGLAGAGVVTLLIGFFTIPSAFATDNEVPALNVGLVIGGFGGIFSGIVSAVVGYNLDAIDASRREVRGWIGDTNAPLRDELGVPDHLALGVTPVEGGAVVGVLWRF